MAFEENRYPVSGAGLGLRRGLMDKLIADPPSEVDFIYGTVIAKGREVDVPTPTLETLAAIVKGLESHYLEAGGET